MIEKAATTILLRAATQDDAAPIARIHDQGLATGHASFRDQPSDWTEIVAASASCCLRVAEVDGAVVGWATVAPTSGRPTYAGVGEASLYVAEEARGRGVGRALLGDIVAASEAAGFWTLVAQVFPENRASLALFRGGGFHRVGLRERLGRMSHGPMAGRWRDVVMLERRSQHVGTETTDAGGRAD